MIGNSRLSSPGTRLEQLLDTAGELLLQVGYQRVIVEEVARRAGVDRSAVYARFPTKESLYLTVLLRAQRRSVDHQVLRMRADPTELLPSRMSRTHYLSLLADPVLAALYIRDPSAIGRLTAEVGGTLAALAEARKQVIIEQLTVLRRHGCVREERTPETQYHVLMAIFSGWFAADVLPSLPPNDEVRADLLAETVARALEVDDPRLDGLASEQSHLADRYATLNDLVETEWRRRLG